MKSSITLGLVSLLAVAAVGTIGNTATPALAAEKATNDKIYEICDKVIDYYDDYKFGDYKTYKVYKLCEKLVDEKPTYMKNLCMTHMTLLIHIIHTTKTDKHNPIKFSFYPFHYY
jgi:hypothetical protein